MSDVTAQIPVDAQTGSDGPVDVHIASDIGRTALFRGPDILERIGEMGPEDKGEPVKPYQPMDAVADEVRKFDEKYSKVGD